MAALKAQYGGKKQAAIAVTAALAKAVSFSSLSLKPALPPGARNKPAISAPV